MVERRAEAAGFSGDFRGEHGDAEAEIAQERAEEAVQFVAEAAAAAGDDLVEERRFVERELPAQVDIEVLEWNRVEMGQMQAPQCIGRYAGRSSVIDALQVSWNIQGVSVAESGNMGSDEGTLSPALLRVRAAGAAGCRGSRMEPCRDAPDAGPAMYRAIRGACIWRIS